MTRNIHSIEFQEQALIKVRERGTRSVQDVADDLNMPVGTLRKWISKSNRKDTGSGPAVRLRLATQQGSHLFGVIYVLDEPTAGLHPADGEALISAFDWLKASGNSLFVVEHDLSMMRRADWLVDVGPDAGEQGGEVLYSGAPAGLANIKNSRTRKYLFGEVRPSGRAPRPASGWLRLEGVTRNNLQGLDVSFPIGCFTAVTGVSGSGKSSLVSQALVDLVSEHLGSTPLADEGERIHQLEAAPLQDTVGRMVDGARAIRRLVQVDQKPIGRTPRSNLATSTGLFDTVRKLFAATPSARQRHYDAGRFSFNLPKGRCPTCEGGGAISVELPFMPSVYAPCPDCHGARYNPKTLEIIWQGYNIAQVLNMTVDQACKLFADQQQVLRPLVVLSEIGLGYLRLGQPATELSGGEAQRIKLANELQRSHRGNTLYMDEADHRPSPRRRGSTNDKTSRTGRGRQHGDRGRARDARGRPKRLGDRRRPWYRTRRRTRCGPRNAA